jgi:hypothetical protein
MRHKSPKIRGSTPSQQAAMKGFIAKTVGKYKDPKEQRDACARMWAEAEERGEVVRLRGLDKMTPFGYGQALWYDVTRRLIKEEEK